MTGQHTTQRSPFERISTAYGTHPAHLLVLMASFLLTAYVGVRLLDVQPVSIAVWFVGSLLAHDFFLFPIYAAADLALVRLYRLRGPERYTVPWINYVRFPLAVSGVLLLVWTPLIFQRPGGFQTLSGLTTEPYLGRWLLITAALFAASALMYGVQLARAVVRNRAPGLEDVPPPRPTDAMSP